MQRTRNYHEVKNALKHMTPFEHATCSAQVVEKLGHIFTGRLSKELREALARDFVESWAGTPFYVVYSYGTPIAWAWLDITTPTQMRRIPDHKYSPTTSKQQTYVRAYLPGKDA